MKQKIILNIELEAEVSYDSKDNIIFSFPEPERWKKVIIEDGD